MPRFYGVSNNGRNETVNMNPFSLAQILRIDALNIRKLSTTALSMAVALSSLMPQPCYAQTTEKQPRLAVFNLVSRGGIATDDILTITERVRAQLLQTQRYQMMERDQMAKILQEQGFQQTQVCDNTDCSVRVGRLLGVQQLVTGSVSRLGELYSLSLRLVDVEQGQILKEEFMDCRCGLEEILTRVTGQVVQRLSGATVAVNPVPQSASRPTLSPDQLALARETFRREEKSVVLTAAISLPIPFGYLYLGEPGWFAGVLGIQLASLGWGLFLNGGSLSFLTLTGATVFSVVHAPTMAYFKNVQRMDQLGLTWNTLPTVPNTLPLLAWNHPF